MVRFTSDDYDENSEPKVNLISRFLSVAFLLTSIYTVFKIILSNTSIIYIILISVALLLLNFVFSLVSFKRKTTRKTLIIYDIMSVIFIAGMIFSTIKFEPTVTDSSISEDDEQYITYSIITSSRSNISTPAELDGRELFVYDEPEKTIDNQDLEKAIKNVISDSTITHKNNIEVVMNRAAKLIDSGSIIKNETYESYILDNKGYQEQIRIIEEIKIKTK